MPYSGAIRSSHWVTRHHQASYSQPTPLSFGRLENSLRKVKLKGGILFSVGPSADPLSESNIAHLESS